MKPADRAKLTTALREHVAKIALDLRAQMQGKGARIDAAVRDRAKKLHADEQVGEDFDVWTDLLARRAAVLWILKSVYVRVLEDRGLLSPGRILDGEAQQLFERLAPNLGETAFLRWVYRDLASPRGGLPELFSPQPAEVALPSDALSRDLLRFWRHRDPDSGGYFCFAEEKFEGELMGDLYQELDPVVKDRFALCQTPDFVRAFILDRTLTPAIETFGADEVRLLDPACGSGHFLIDGLKRLVAATAEKHPDWEKKKLVTHCLERVVGIDLNDYACALARARLVMTAAELAGVGTLAEAAQFHPHVYWADGLEQVEREDQKKMLQTHLFEPVEEKPRATLTRSDVRAALKKVFEHRFHAVVANPPYITEKDKARKEYHREKLGKRQRYVSAYREYSLGSPFTERCFQLAENEGFVGIITSNNFMKREFGKPLIEKVLAVLDLTLVVDTSQSYIPFHGTPTVLLFGRNRRPEGKTVCAVMGKRGESGTPDDPAKGKVWSSIEEGWNDVGFENEYVSVAEVPRETLAKHPWSLGGGGAAELKEKLQAKGQCSLGSLAEIGTGAVTREDAVYLIGREAAKRLGVQEGQIRPLVEGDVVRDWAITNPTFAVWPYDPTNLGAVAGSAQDAVSCALWKWRSRLAQRVAYGKSQIEHGLQWFEYSMFFANRFRTPLSIAFAFVATHNHFVLDRGGKVFKQSAPVIKLPAGATEDDHLALLGLLNSSTACFLMKQVFHAKGGVDRCLVEAWDMYYEFDSTKMKLFPVLAASSSVTSYARRLDQIAGERAACSVDGVLAAVGTASTADSLKSALDARRRADLADFHTMVALQEELDWLCYTLYGLDDESDLVEPDEIEPLQPTSLPWCLTLANKDLAIRATIDRGEIPAELPTDWFKRHGWKPEAEASNELSSTTRARIAARQARTRSNPALSLIENANFKRRWYKPDYDAEEQLALNAWLSDRVEKTAKDRAHPANVEQITASLQDDPRVLAVCEVLTGRRDFSLSQLVGDALFGDAVPEHPCHIYKQSGLVKREVWERTWEDQRREDAGEQVKPEVPPAYKPTDFLKTEYWRLRGKLDVPKERFIAFTEVPGRNGADTLYGWAGWTPLQRLKAILAIDEELEDGGLPLADRIALLDSAWHLLPDVAREDPAVASRLKAELQALVGADGPSKELLEDWRKRFPPPGGRGSRKNGTAAKKASRQKAREVEENEVDDADDGDEQEEG